MRIGNLSTCGRGFFLALSAARHARGHRVHYVRRKFGPRLGSVALALGVQCRTHELPLCHGVAFRRARVKQNDGNPHKQKRPAAFFFACFALCNSSHLKRQPRYNSSLASSFSLSWRQRTMFLHVSACVCLCVGVCRRTHQRTGTR